MMADVATHTVTSRRLASALAQPSPSCVVAAKSTIYLGDLAGILSWFYVHLLRRDSASQTRENDSSRFRSEYMCSDDTTVA